MKFEKSFKKSLKSLTKRSGSYISQFTSIEGGRSSRSYCSRCDALQNPTLDDNGSEFGLKIATCKHFGA